MEAGTAVYVHDMGLNNKTNAADGSIDNEGDMHIDGDWNNNAVGGSVFINQNATGTVHFTGSAAQTLGGTRTTAFEGLTINNTSAAEVNLE